MKNFIHLKHLYISIFISFIICFNISCSYQPNFDYDDYVNIVDDVSISKEGDVYVVSPAITENNEVAINGLIFYPGAYVSYEAYLPLMVECARNGVKCFLVEMPSDLAILDKNAAKKIIKNKRYADIQNWYIGGHSLGGAMAAAYASKRGEYFKGLVLLAAYSVDDLTDSGLKVLSVYGSKDGVLNKEKYDQCLSNLPAGYEEHVLDGGNHANFGEYGAQAGDNEATMDSEEQKKLTGKFIGEFCCS